MLEQLPKITKVPTFLTGNKLTAAITMPLSLSTLLGAYSIWLEEQSAVPVVRVVE